MRRINDRLTAAFRAFRIRSLGRGVFYREQSPVQIILGPGAIRSKFGDRFDRWHAAEFDDEMARRGVR